MNFFVESYLTDEEEQLEGHQQRNKDRILGVWAKFIWRYIPTIYKHGRDEATERNFYRANVVLLDADKAIAYHKFMVDMSEAKTVEEKGALAAMFFSRVRDY